MEKALLDTTPIPADIIHHLIAPMTYALNHRASFDAVLTQLRSKQVRAKAYQAIQDAKYGAIGLDGGLVCSARAEASMGWFNLSASDFQMGMDVRYNRRPTLQQHYRNFMLNRLRFQLDAALDAVR